jgi:hypothetical protein
MSFKEFMMKDTAGIPNWGWTAIIVVGIGVGLVLPHFFHHKGDDSDQDQSTGGGGGGGPSGATGDAPGEDSGFPIEASSENAVLPYPGLPADTASIINETGAGLGSFGYYQPDFLSDPYPWWHRRFYRNPRDRHRYEPKRRARRRMNNRDQDIEDNLNGNGLSGRGMTVASRVGSR